MRNVRKIAFTCVGHEKVEEVGQNIKAYQKFEYWLSVMKRQ
jgi:hypothetical protein